MLARVHLAPHHHGGLRDEFAFVDHYLNRIAAKLGLARSPELAPLVNRLLELLHENRVDYTIFFRRLNAFQAAVESRNDAVRDLFLDRAAFDAWAQDYAALLRQAGEPYAARKARLDRINPKFILRNYLAQAAIAKAQARDFSEVDRLLKLVQSPYGEHPELEHYAGFPPDWAAGIEVSCSS